ncbi:MAG TPA: heparinase II/III family protein [Candidatus Acidoferrum sp.]|nr:heparinase II/III family protein [Candidatus Acidoferrum sp.]
MKRRSGRTVNVALACWVCLLGAGGLSLATLFPQRPFVLVSEQELSALRAELAGPGWKADLYRSPRGFAVLNSGRGVRANADLWLHRTIQIPARGGHYHQFFCEDGNQLALPEGQVFVPGPYKCPKCGRLYAGEKYEAALRRLVHGWLAQAALDLALVSAIEHRPDYAAKCAEILIKYADAYPGPHTSALAGGMIYQSLDEAMWVIPLGQAYDLIYGQIGDAERAKIETFLRAVARGLQACGTQGNWGSWHLSAVGVVGYATEDEELLGWATQRFQQQIREQLGDDGLWPESVHTYHYFSLLAFAQFAEAARHAGLDLYHWEGKPGKSLLSMFRAPLAYAYPDLRLPAINDGWYEAFVPGDLYELGYCRTHDPQFGWVLAKAYKADLVPAGLVPAGGRKGAREGLYAFLFGGAIPTQISPPLLASTNFSVLGICALRSTNGAMMTFHYGPCLGHGHRDKMGITLFANRKLWLADYGTPGYGAAILPWYQSTLAHNTVVVDGKTQAPTKENQVKLWLGGNDLEAAESVTSEAYAGVKHSRTVVRIGDYFVVADRLESQAEHTYDLYLHSEGELSLAEGASALQTVASPSRWIESPRAAEPRPTISGRWGGTGGVDFWIAGSGRVTPILAQCPAETGSRKVSLLIARQEARTAVFTTVLFPYQGETNFAVEPEAQDIIVHHAGLSDRLVLAPGARPILFHR